ncbi:MAG: response regulator [Calditrichaeota bacterium]|nr:response regulator [Calditrichota bacterium]
MAEENAASLSGRGETILLVEDEEGVRESISRVLRDNGYNVLEARDAREGLRIAEEHTGPIHLTLADVVLPRMSGPEMVRHLEKIRPESRVLYMSGYTDSEIVKSGVLQPGIHYLEKPFSPPTLLRKIRHVLESD